MIVECDRCQAKYHYDEARFGGKASKKLRCSKCHAIFEVFNTQSYEAQPILRPSSAPDETATRRPSEGNREEPTRKTRLSTAEHKKASELKLPADVKLSLAVIAGPEAGRIFSIEKPRVTIGREGADLVLDDPEISRQHAALEISGDLITLVDLGSTNGTLLGEEQVTEAPLENQGEFTIGGSTLMLIVRQEA